MSLKEVYGSREEKLEKIYQILRQVEDFYPDLEIGLDPSQNKISVSFTVGNPEEQDKFLAGTKKNQHLEGN